MFLAIFITLSLVIMISIVLIGLYSSYKSTLEEMHEPTPNQEVTNQSVEEEPELVDPFIVLMYGIDQRPNTYDAGRPDTLMLALVDPELLKISLISIPRDSYVSIPGYRI